MEQNGAILARSFSRQERKTIGWCATLAIFVLIFTFCNSFFKPYITADNNDVPSPLSNVQVHDGINIAPQPYSKINDAKAICDLKRRRSDICEANGDIRVIGGDSSTVFVVSNAHSNTSWNIRPYARKWDESALRRVRNLTIKQVHHSDQRIPRCTTKYDVPAVVFSSGGYAGNLFHDFTDLIIPLYLTSREFEGEVQFLVTDKRPSWMDKFEHVLQRLSRYEIIDLDQEKDKNVLCFPRIIVGLKANREFSINVAASASDHIPLFSMKNFTAFLRSTYGLKRDIVNNKLQQPRLLIISRNNTRRFLNAGEVSATAENLGFEVVVQETESNVSRVSRLVNGFDVMVGVHGAGLANMVFLPENAVVVQVVGLGMNWIAKTAYEQPTLDMGLRYLEYKIGVNESSLRNSSDIRFQGWTAFTTLYLNGQDVKLDVNRFRATLLKALQLLHA